MTLTSLIWKLQRALNTAGVHPPLIEDGLFGAETRNALDQFDVALSLTRKAASTPHPSRDLSAGLEMIKRWEGLFLHAYQDTGGVWTIGWGTIRYPNGHPVKSGDVITSSEAQDYLMLEINPIVEVIESIVKVPISNNAFCALVSFTYNVGTTALRTSHLLKRLNEGDTMRGVAAEFDKWIMDNGKVVNGLVRRRSAEKQLFLS